jgi:hypothetical protein
MFKICKVIADKKTKSIGIIDGFSYMIFHKNITIRVEVQGKALGWGP